MSKTTIFAILAGVFAAIGVMPPTAMTWLHGYQGDVQSCALFVGILFGVITGVVAKDYNQTGGNVAITAEAKDRISEPHATDKPALGGDAVKVPIVLGFLLLCSLGLTGCATSGTSTTTPSGTASVGLTAQDEKAIRDGANALSTLAIRYAVSPADKITVAQQIHDVAVQIETMSALSGVVPSGTVDNGIASVLPAADWAQNFRTGLVGVYRTWGKYGARVLSAMAAGLADATENLTP